MCALVHVCVCTLKKVDGIFLNTRENNQKRVGGRMLQMAMLLCMGMLTVGHRKVSQLGEVTISFLCGANGRQKDQQTDGQTD